MKYRDEEIKKNMPVSVSLTVTNTQGTNLSKEVVARGLANGGLRFEEQWDVWYLIDADDDDAICEITLLGDSEKK